MKKITDVEPKNLIEVEKLLQIQFLMSQRGAPHAIRLQLENLVLTYGFEAVKKEMDTINIQTKKVG